jgi:type IX secretion system PorP/SprF family membrane protein
MMDKRISTVCVTLCIFMFIAPCKAQENLFSHYFTTAVNNNPAFAGETRYAQISADNRIQPMVSSPAIYNMFLSLDQKVPNHHSGINISFNQKLSNFKELQVKLNYSYTVNLNRITAIKGGIGLSWNSINTYANTYKYPDQYDMNGLTGDPTHEPSIHEKCSYPSATAGIVFYSSSFWISAGFDNLNRPAYDFAGEKTRVPLGINVTGGYFFPIDKNKRSKRIFSQNGGWEPYSSIGPVVEYSKLGPFNKAGFGVNAFIKPVFWGMNYQIRTFKGQEIKSGSGSLNLTAGFRNEFISVAYSYDIMVKRTTTNYKGAHEISLIYYFYTIREDYKKNIMVPFPNQLMY